jgi:hypothetical protein
MDRRRQGCGIHRRGPAIGGSLLCTVQLQRKMALQTESVMGRMFARSC